MLKGLDLSHWNRIYSYEACGRQADFIILKCSEGTSMVDNTFAPRLRQFKARTDSVIGAYHWLYKQDGAAQARHFIRTVKNANGGTLDGVIMCVDVETTVYDGSKSAKFYSLEEFYEEFYRLTNMTLVVYTSPGYWNRMVRYARDKGDPIPHKSRIPNTVLWKAHWVISAKGRDLEDTPAPGPGSIVWNSMGGYQKKDIAMVQCLSLVKISGKPPMKGYDGNVSHQSKDYLRSLTREGRPRPDDEDNVISCPKGYRLDKASGNCVPIADGGDQEPEVPDEPKDKGDVDEQATGVLGAGVVAGLGGGAIIAAIVIGIAVFMVWAAVKGGGDVTPVVDRGDRD